MKMIFLWLRWLVLTIILKSYCICRHLFFIFILCVWPSACTRVHTLCVSKVPAEARRGHWIPWDLGLRMVVSCHGSAGNRKQVLCRSSECSQLQSRLSAPRLRFETVWEATPHRHCVVCASSTDSRHDRHFCPASKPYRKDWSGDVEVSVRLAVTNLDPSPWRQHRVWSPGESLRRTLWAGMSPEGELALCRDQCREGSSPHGRHSAESVLL